MQCLKKIRKILKDATAKLLGLSFMRMLATFICSLKESQGARQGSGRSILKCSWNACLYVCSHALPKPAHGLGFPKAAWEMICKVAPLFLTVCNRLRFKQSAAEVSMCLGAILIALQSSLGLLVIFISGKYFSMETLRCFLWIVFNAHFGKCCINLNVLTALSSPPVSHWIF